MSASVEIVCVAVVIAEFETIIAHIYNAIRHLVHG